MNPADRTSIESLLAHRQWVRTLALRLARDDAAADDLEQDVWLAAVRSPPASGSLRGWLGTVMRNRSRERARSDVRREARETAVSRADRAPAADEVVSRADAHRHVVTTVLTLDEPYRTTVLLLFLEGMSPKDVAAHQGVPVDTVRTRARRALATLRARLDRDHGGDRGAWAVAILGNDVWTLVGGTVGPVATAGGAVAVGGLLGTGVLVGTGTTIGAAVAGVVAGVLLTLALHGSGATDAASGVGRDFAQAPPAVRPPRADVRQIGDEGGAPPTGESPGDPAVGASNDATDEFPPEIAGAIRGHVRFADGSPVPGVTVRAFLTPQFVRRERASGPPPRSTEEELVGDARRRARWDRETTREAISDAAGAYELSDLRDGLYHLGAWRAGMDMRPAPGTKDWTARAGGTLDFQARVQMSVEVAVVDAAGAAPDDAVVYLRPPGQKGGGTSSRWAPDRPTVQIEPGTWELTAEIRGDDEARSDPVTVTVTPGTPTHLVTLRLRGVPRIRGTVGVPAGQSWSSIDVYAVLHAGAEPTDPELRSGTRTTARAPGYEFTLDKLVPGTYTLAVATGDRTGFQRRTVVVGEGTSEVQLAMPELGPDLVVRVRVSGPDGSPVDDARFQLEFRGPNGYGGAVIHDHLQADGSTLCPIWGLNQELNHWDRPGVHWILHVSSESLGSRRVPFVRGTDAALDVRFEEPASLEVTVLGYDAARHRGKANVSVRPADEDSQRMLPVAGPQTPQLDGLGRVTIPLLQPGEYVAQLVVGRIVVTQRVTVGSDTARVSLQMPRLVTVTVRAPDLRAGDQVAFFPARALGETLGVQVVTLGDDLTARWEDVPVGDYVFAGMIGGERREMRLAVTDAGTYTFAPGVLDGLEITIDDPGGMLARAGFRTGDVIARIDGATFDTTWKARTLISGTRRKESIEFGVVRGGTEIAVTASPDVLSTFLDVGGHWEAVTR